jgi:hypothetical protein
MAVNLVSASMVACQNRRDPIAALTSVPYTDTIKWLPLPSPKATTTGTYNPNSNP